jgi:hypothetical protein
MLTALEFALDVQPRNNTEYWSTKLDGNVRSDRLVDERLRSGGWTVIGTWEHVPSEAAAGRIAATVDLGARDNECATDRWRGRQPRRTSMPYSEAVKVVISSLVRGLEGDRDAVDNARAKARRAVASPLSPVRPQVSRAQRQA